MVWINRDANTGSNLKRKAFDIKLCLHKAARFDWRQKLQTYLS